MAHECLNLEALFCKKAARPLDVSIAFEKRYDEVIFMVYALICFDCC